MEAFQEKSILDNQQESPDLRLQSDHSINSDEVVEVLAQEFENLVVSCRYDVPDRDLSGHSVVIDDEGEVKRATAEELRDLVVKEAINEAFQAESTIASEEKNGGDARHSVGEGIERHDLKKGLDDDPKECRVLDERAVGIEEENFDVDGAGSDEVLEHTEDDLKENHEIGIGDVGGGGGGGSEFVSYENDDEERSEYENDRGFENEEDLQNESEIASGEGGSMIVPDDGGLRRYHYPLRPDAEDCSYYMRTGMCKFGSNCKFNHPLRRRTQLSKEAKKQKEENPERPGQIECKFYLSSGGCKYGKACKFNHTRGKTVVAPVFKHNFLGLPIRPGEKECPYYMRNGSCKYGPNCRFNHPDPTAVGGDAPAAYGNDGPVHLQKQNASQPNVPSWSAPRTPDPTSAFVPVMYSPTHSMPPPSPDWNGYQVPVPVPVPAPAPAPAHIYPSSERGLPIPPAFFLNNPPSDTNMYTHHQQQMIVSDYPERPGQPECSYFMKTGDCKYKSACKFHHPQSRVTRPAPSVLSDKGLPIRPDQNICTHYSRYGICKYGPACKYDHPVNYSNPIPAGGGGYRPDRSEIQQSM